MKRIMSLLLSMLLLMSLCACGKDGTENSSEPETTTEEITSVEPEEAVLEEPEEPTTTATAQLIVNSASNDTETNISIFPLYDERSSGAWYHFMIESEDDEIPIRVLIESQWGRDDKTEEDFQVESDELMTVKPNEWISGMFDLMDSNLYFYRVTLYYGETTQILSTTTIYTPDEDAIYALSDIRNAEPKFHAYNELTEEEQELYEKCEYAVFDYAEINHYSAIASFRAWQWENSLYLYIEFSKPIGRLWFAIDMDDYTKYVAHFDADYIMPEGAGRSENNVLFDYYYFIKALNEHFE